MVMLREPVAVSVLVTLVVVAGCGGGESDSDSTTRDTAVVVSSVAGGVDEPVVSTGAEPGDGSLEEEVLVDGSGVVLQVRTTGPSGAADTHVFGLDWLERHQEILAVAPLDTVVIGDAGHLVLAERPDATLAASSAFLDAHRGQ